MTSTKKASVILAGPLSIHTEPVSGDLGWRGPTATVTAGGPQAAVLPWVESSRGVSF